MESQPESSGKVYTLRLRLKTNESLVALSAVTSSLVHGKEGRGYSMTAPPKLHIIRCLTDVAKENNFVAARIFSFLFKFMALDANLSYLDNRSLINELFTELDEIKAYLPSTTEGDVKDYLDSALQQSVDLMIEEE